MATQIDLLIHLEQVPDPDPGFVWWAESPDLPGFSAAADHLPDLLRQAEAAIDDLVADAEIVPMLCSGDAGRQESVPPAPSVEPGGVENLRTVEGFRALVAA